MEVKADDTAVRRFRRRAVLCWIMSGVLIVVVIGSALLYRNPWLVHRMTADQATEDVLEKIADSRSPYVKIDGIDLNFTGYYKVSSDGTVYAYCYMGAVGDCYVLADLPAEDDGALAEDMESDGKELTDYTLTGQLIRSDEMTGCLAEAEDMSTEAYRDYYHMAEVEVHDYNSDQERLRIYQLMLLVLAAGMLAAGWICLSESKITESTTEDENI